MRLVLVVNPASSSVTARARVVIAKALGADHEVTVAETSRRGHAARLAQGAAAEGVDVVVVLGGDGTVNEAANGVAGTRTALGVLPGGSTNVFARTIGMTNDPVEATGELVSALGRRSWRRVGLGTVNGRYFCFHVGVGFDAAVVKAVERRGDLKRYAGHPLFVAAGLATFRRYDRRRFRVEAPGAAVSGSFAICLNTDPYTYLGNRSLRIAPEATLDRGLVMVTFRSLDPLTLGGAIASALGPSGRLPRSKWVDYRTDLAALDVTGSAPIPYQVDGDFLGDATTLAFRHEPDALELVLP